MRSPHKAILLMSLLVASCSATVPANRILPPADLLADCPHPAAETKTNGQLAETILRYRAALTRCNLDKQALRQWAED